MKRWRWHDTLFARLFALLWGTLLASHAVAFLVVTQLAMPLTAPADGHATDHPHPSVIFPSLPPARLSQADTLSSAAAGHDVPGLPWPLLLLDYAVRLLVMGLGAWWGSRWLSQPVTQLIAAAHQMSTSLDQGQQPNPINEAAGTLEAQQAAKVFNQLSMDLYRAFRSRELLFATVSHDLRTPMTRIRLRLESPLTPEDVSRCIGDLLEMDQLVRQALDMARLQAQPMALQPTRMDAMLQAVVDDYTETGAPVFWLQAVVCADTPTATPAVTALADPLALRRVLDNVLQNALRHATQVHISLHLEPAQNTVVIALEDNGPGIEEALLAQVLAPDARHTGDPSHGTGKSVGAGSSAGHGLGLYIAQHLMLRQGGSMALCNRPEGGLRVVLQLKSSTG